MSKDLDRIIEGEEYLAKEARDPLAQLYRLIWSSIELKKNTINVDLMNRWLNEKQRIPIDNIKARSTERGNLIQELTRPNMTWKVFLKGLRFLPIVRVRLIAEIEWDNRKTTQSSVSFLVGEELDNVDNAPPPR